MAFRLDPDAADALNGAALKQSTTVGELLRGMVAHYLGASSARPQSKGSVQATTEPAAPEDHANAVTLKPKNGAKSPDEAAEQSWFQKGNS